MTKFTQKQLREMVISGVTEDVTSYNMEKADALRSIEEWIDEVVYSSGIYGCNGQLLRGHNSGKLYAITSRTQAIYLF